MLRRQTLALVSAVVLCTLATQTCAQGFRDEYFYGFASGSGSGDRDYGADYTIPPETTAPSETTDNPTAPPATVQATTVPITSQAFTTDNPSFSGSGSGSGLDLISDPVTDNIPTTATDNLSTGITSSTSTTADNLGTTIPAPITTNVPSTTGSISTTPGLIPTSSEPDRMPLTSAATTETTTPPPTTTQRISIGNPLDPVTTTTSPPMTNSTTEFVFIPRTQSTTTEAPTTEPTTESICPEPPTFGEDYIQFYDIVNNARFISRTDDRCSRVQMTGQGVPFGSQVHTTYHVCANGLITVGSFPIQLWSPSPFPTNRLRVRESNVLAPFWNDHDLRISDAFVYFREYGPGEFNGPKQFVSEYISFNENVDFLGNWMLVVYWVNAPTFPATAQSPRNTYQAILISDGLSTYVVYTYNCGMLQWGESQNGVFAVIGYSTNSESAFGSELPSFRNHILSRQPTVMDIACRNRDCGIEWSSVIYKVGETVDTEQLARVECMMMLEQPQPMVSESDLSMCPCNAQQARRDTSWRRVLQPQSYRNCYVSTTVPSGNTVLCCYQRGTLSPQSRPVLNNPRRNPARFLDQDDALFRLCEQGGLTGSEEYNQARPQANCLEYNIVEPDDPDTGNNDMGTGNSDMGTGNSDTGTGNSDMGTENSDMGTGNPDTETGNENPGTGQMQGPPLPPTQGPPPPPPVTFSFCYGDPHLTSLDGANVTFNGWGEYVVIRFQNNRTQFELQSRTEPVPNSNATQLVAFAFAMLRHSPVEIQLNTTTKEMSILLNGTDFTDSLANTDDEFETDFLYVTRFGPRSFFTSFPNGMGMIVNASEFNSSIPMLSFTMIVPDAFRGIIVGMLGDYDGDSSNDVIFRNGTTLLGNVTDRQIHEMGQSWQLQANESLFTYPEGLSYLDYAHPEHIPPFSEEVLANAPLEVIEACEGSADCIYDACQTGDMSVGLETRTVALTNFMELAIQLNSPPFISGPNTLNVMLGIQAELILNVTDRDSDSNFSLSLIGGLPASSDLSFREVDNFTSEYTFRLTLNEITRNLSLVFLATDELGTSSMFPVQVVLCACENGGNCTSEGILDVSASTIVQNCICSEAWEGQFCETDVDGCLSFNCFEEDSCEDVPAPSSGAECGPCPSGYSGDGQKCDDIDECSMDIDNCQEDCLNNAGSFVCTCPSGFMLVNDTQCQDVDECALLNGGCHQVCNNTEGSFVCACSPGFSLNTSDNTICQVDGMSMCTPDNNCTQTCVSLLGVDTCGCNLGYQLAGDNITCSDINECEEGPCEQNCSNSEGSFQCSCADGYTLMSGRFCQDIDECAEAAMMDFELCDITEICLNTDGGFNCTCPPGSVLLQGSNGTFCGLISAQTCGDAMIDGNDMCDDNNTMSGDGCSDLCQIETGYNCSGEPSICSPICGDALIIGVETCDDNNTISGDGCSYLCTIEAGFNCSNNVPTICTSICSDGLIVSNEQCDDGGTTSGDGCNSTCGIEMGFACTGEPSVCSAICGDGVLIEGMEECDDGNAYPNDGCTETCRVVLLDLNIPDNTTLSYSDEFFDLNEVVFLFDPNNTNFSSFFLSPNGGNWTDIYLLILNGVDPIDVEVNVYSDIAAEAERIPATDVSSIFFVTRRLFAGDMRADGLGIDLDEIVTGMLINGAEESLVGGGDELLSQPEIESGLQSIGFIAREHPGYGPRDVCVVAEDNLYSSLACVTLYFIGRNDDPPTITYSPDSTAQFVEGQSEFVQIVIGSLNVTDPDHPTRYPLMSASAAIMGFQPSHPEELSVTSQNPDFSYYYNQSSGVLTVSGNGTTDIYSQILSNLTYHNNMTEPAGATRTIRVTVSDGNAESNPLLIIVRIINVNDAPIISLDGSVTTRAEAIYTEGDGEKMVVPELVVIDTDPVAMIQRAMVTLTNPVDTDFESISFNTNISSMGLQLNATSYSLELTGIATPEVYTEALRSVTYLHSDTNPGNPTTLPPRMMEFVVEDENGAISSTSVLSISLVPINDGPILLFVADPALRDGSLVLEGQPGTQTESTFMYLEDGQALNIGADIYLRDIDSNISSVTVFATGLLDGPQDQLFFSRLYGVIQNTTELDGGNRSIVLSGNFLPEVYEHVLRSLSYQNGFTNNSVTDGQRTLSIVAEDTQGALSTVMYIVTNIFVMDRNDGPDVDLGPGVNVDHTIRFTEGGPSIAITQTFLASLSDEEGHNISRMTVELLALNGNLDANEAIFIRSTNPLQAEFLNFIDVSNTTYISISVNASARLYQQALTSIFYNNFELEPTLYNASTSNNRLLRVIVISITDANYIDPTTNPANVNNANLGISTTTVRIGVLIEGINDNQPRIIIRSFPDSCSTDSQDVDGVSQASKRRRRDIKTMSRLRKRSVPFNSKEVISQVMAPKIISAVPTFIDTSSPNNKCLQQITITFNTETNAPFIEVPAAVSDLISFEPPHLDTTKKIGRWSRDYRSLVVSFTEDCLEIELETTSGKPRLMFISFEAEQGDCNWDTPCTNGLCFFNETGCPMISYTLINSNNPVVSTAVPTKQADDAGPCDDRLKTTPLVVLFYCGITALLLLVALAGVMTCITAYRKHHTFGFAKNKKIEITSALKPNTIEDLPVVVKFDTPNITTEAKFVATQAIPTVQHVPNIAQKKTSCSKSEDKMPLSLKSTDQLESRDPTGQTLNKMPLPGKKRERQLPRAKRKPLFNEDGPVLIEQDLKDVSASNERLQEVATCKCILQSQQQPMRRLGQSAITQNSKVEQSLVIGHKTQPVQTTIKTGSRENNQTV